MSRQNGQETALDRLGYRFNERDQLTELTTGKGFVFKGQEHYEELGVAINEYIYDLLQSRCGLEKREFPPQSSSACPGFFFASNDVSCNDRGLLVLIHGSGAVRAGQWSRRLIINSSLDSGSQIPYIMKAKAEGWAVVVMNTNQRYDCSTSGTVYEGFSPEEHAWLVWDSVIKDCPAQRIAIVAHSYGGQVTSWLLRTFNDDFKKRVVAIAFTDAFSTIMPDDKDYFSRIARNWVTSRLPANETVGPAGDCTIVSAGTIAHEETSWQSMKYVFSFVKRRFDRCLPIQGSDKASSGCLSRGRSPKHPVVVATSSTQYSTCHTGVVDADHVSIREVDRSMQASSESEFCTMSDCKSKGQQQEADLDLKQEGHLEGKRKREVSPHPSGIHTVPETMPRGPINGVMRDRHRMRVVDTGEELQGRATSQDSVALSEMVAEVGPAGTCSLSASLAHDGDHTSRREAKRKVHLVEAEPKDIPDRGPARYRQTEAKANQSSSSHTQLDPVIKGRHRETDV